VPGVLGGVRGVGGPKKLIVRKGGGYSRGGCKPGSERESQVEKKNLVTVYNRKKLTGGLQMVPSTENLYSQKGTRDFLVRREGEPKKKAKDKKNVVSKRGEKK